MKPQQSDKKLKNWATLGFTNRENVWELAEGYVVVVQKKWLDFLFQFPPLHVCTQTGKKHTRRKKCRAQQRPAVYVHKKRIWLTFEQKSDSPKEASTLRSLGSSPETRILEKVSEMGEKKALKNGIEIFRRLQTQFFDCFAVMIWCGQWNSVEDYRWKLGEKIVNKQVNTTHWSWNGVTISSR